MAYQRNQRILDQFGKRLKAFREKANLSQEQVHYSTGIGQSNIYKIESGKLNTSLSQLATLSELFGLEDHELLDYKAAIPDIELLRKSISKFLIKRGIDPAILLKKSLTYLLREKILESKFLNSPKYSKEIVDHLFERYNSRFTTSHVSRAMDGFSRKGLIEKIPTSKKSKFQYKKK